jgi:hypothetical protein
MPSITQSLCLCKLLELEELRIKSRELWNRACVIWKRSLCACCEYLTLVIWKWKLQYMSVNITYIYGTRGNQIVLNTISALGLQSDTESLTETGSGSLSDCRSMPLQCGSNWNTATNDKSIFQLFLRQMWRVQKPHNPYHLLQVKSFSDIDNIKK